MSLPRTDRVVGRFQRLEHTLVAAFTLRLERFFEAQQRRVIARYLAFYAVADAVAPQPHAEELLPDQERRDLWLAMLPFLMSVFRQTGDLAGLLVGLADLPENDPRIGVLLNEIGPRLDGIHRTTLNAISATLAEGTLAGYTVAQIADGVPEDGYRGLHIVAQVYMGRSRAIARTEIATVRQLAALERYQEAGLPMVRVSDGEGCGWMYHNDPDKADRTHRTIFAARAYPLSHPNCVRQFLPVRSR